MIMCCKIQVHKALCFFGLLLYLGVLPLYIYLVSEWYVHGKLHVFLSLLVLLIAPMIVVNLVSAILVMRNEDFTGRFLAQNLCIASHCCQMGLLWRVVILIKSFDKRKFLEFSLLMTGQAATSFLPFLLVEGYLLQPQLNIIPSSAQAFIVMCLITSALSFVLTQIGFRSEQEGVEEVSGVKFILLTLCHVMGLLCLLISRCLSIVLFTYSLTYWIFLLIGLHFILCLASSLLYTHLQLKKVNFLCILRHAGLMFLHVYDSVSTRPGPGKCVNVLYYTLMLVENILMTAVWVMTSGPTDIAKLVVVMVMLGTFVLGVILKFVCYNYEDDDSSAEDSDRKTLDVTAVSRSSIAQRTPRSSEGQCHHIYAGQPRSRRERHQESDIASNKATVSARISKIRRGGQRTASTSHTSDNSSGTRTNRNYSPQSYNNHAFDDTEVINNESQKIDKCKTINVENCRKSFGKSITGKTSSDTFNIGRVPSKKAQNSRAMLKAQRGYCSEEQTDIGSSNSRNTNTLDVSNQSSRGENLTRFEQDFYNVPQNREMVHNWRQKPSDRPREVEQKAPARIANLYHERQLRPQSCAPYIPDGGNVEPRIWCTGQTPHAGRGYVAGGRFPGWGSRTYAEDQYSCDYTDTTSYYDSLSYYYTVTSTHSSSDSDCARTWPPSLPTGLQNHGAELPHEKLSPEERISIWFQRSKQYFSQDLINMPSAVTNNQPPGQSSRFEPNRRTFAGYKNKLSFSSTSSRRLPPRGIKPTSQYKQHIRHLGNSDQYRIQFQTYMDSLKKRRQSENPKVRLPVPGGVINTEPVRGAVTGRRIELRQGTRDEYLAKQTFHETRKPPRPPRPPKPVMAPQFMSLPHDCHAESDTTLQVGTTGLESMV